MVVYQTGLGTHVLEAQLNVFPMEEGYDHEWFLISLVGEKEEIVTQSTNDHFYDCLYEHIETLYDRYGHAWGIDRWLEHTVYKNTVIPWLSAQEDIADIFKKSNIPLNTYLLVHINK